MTFRLHSQTRVTQHPPDACQPAELTWRGRPETRSLLSMLRVVALSCCIVGLLPRSRLFRTATWPIGGAVIGDEYPLEERTGRRASSASGERSATPLLPPSVCCMWFSDIGGLLLSQSSFRLPRPVQRCRWTLAKRGHTPPCGAPVTSFREPTYSITPARSVACIRGVRVQCGAVRPVAAGHCRSARPRETQSTRPAGVGRTQGDMQRVTCATVAESLHLG